MTFLKDKKATLNDRPKNLNSSKSHPELSEFNFLAGESETQKRETDKRFLTLLLNKVEEGEFKHPEYVAYTKKKKEIIREAERQKAG